MYRVNACPVKWLSSEHRLVIGGKLHNCQGNGAILVLMILEINDFHELINVVLKKKKLKTLGFV